VTSETANERDAGVARHRSFAQRHPASLVAAGILVLAVGVGAIVVWRSDRPLKHFCTPSGTISGTPEENSGPTPEAAIRATLKAAGLHRPGKRLENVQTGGTEQQWLDLDDGSTYFVAPMGSRFTVTMYGPPCDDQRRPKTG
jgi:hypothetical protein